MAGPFPDSYPDEILYSLAGRHNDRMGYPDKMIVLERLFGYRGPVPSIDLPSRLGHLAAYLFEEYDYSVAQIIDQHTLLPYYGAFLPPDKLNLVRQSMEASDSQKASAYAGLAATRVKGPEWLRYCPVCVQEERKQIGECYWHRLHQLPGVEVCPKHEVWLEQSDILVRRQVHQYEFLSAEKRVPVTDPRALDLTDICHQDLLYLTKESAWLLQQPNFNCNLEALHKQYIAALINRGLAACRREASQ